MAAMPHTSIFLPTMAAMPLTCATLFGGNAARQGRCENHNSTVKTGNTVNASAAAAPKKVQTCIQCHVHVLHQQACARNVFYLTKQSFENTRAYCQNALDLCTGVKLNFVLPPEVAHAKITYAAKYLHKSLYITYQDTYSLIIISL